MSEIVLMFLPVYHSIKKKKPAKLNVPVKLRTKYTKFRLLTTLLYTSTNIKIFIVSLDLFSKICSCRMYAELHRKDIYDLYVMEYEFIDYC